MIKKTVSILLLILSVQILFGQYEEKLSVEESKVVLLGKTKKLSELIAIEESDPTKKAKYKQNKKTPNNFFNRPERKLLHPELEHQGEDKIRQSQNRSEAGEIEIFVNRDGMANTNVFPMDPTCSVGIDYFMQAINATRVGIYDKEGNIITQFSGNTLWFEFNISGRGDPVIMYDQEKSQWLITEFADPTSMLIAVSETSDPFGSYYIFDFVAPNFPDYPKFGIWSDHLAISTNELGPGQLHQYFIEREPLMTGDQTARMQRVSLNGTTNLEAPILITTPVDWEGFLRPTDDRPMVLRLSDSSWGTSSQDGINVYHFDIDYDDPSNTSFETTFIQTSPYDGFPCQSNNIFRCIPQLDGDLVSGMPEIIMNTSQYRNFGTHESIVMTFITDATNGNNLAGIRWIELRYFEDENSWNLYQEGTFAPNDGLHRYMPSIAIDRLGCIAIAYGVSNEDNFIGLRMTGRCPGDTFGEMSFDETTIVEGLGPLETGGRYGDYAHLAVDPKDQATMWFTSEYGGLNGRSRTRITSFRIGRDDFDMKAEKLASPISSLDLSTNETISFEVLNEGLNPIENYTISYSLDGEFKEEIFVEDIIESRQSKIHDFTVPSDFSEIRQFEITTIVSYDQDDYRVNDTLISNVYNYPEYDAAIDIIPSINNCGLSKSFEIQVTNLGGLPLTSGRLEFYLNGVLIDDRNWNGDLLPEQSDIVNYQLEEAAEEINLLEVIFVEEDSVDDFNADNNQSDIEFAGENLGSNLTLTLQTDKSPNETTWTVTDQVTGEILAEGGPYDEEETLYEEEICVKTENCYVFTLFDSGGDGICCGNGLGLYRLTNEDDDNFFTSFGMFSFEENHSFCPSKIECDIIADVNVGYSDDDDIGSILVTVSNGEAPYQFSIDDGITFQDENIFENLPAGTYNLLVLSSDSTCTYQEVVEVSLSTDVEDIEIEKASFTISPNPTEGVFNIALENFETDKNILKFQIIDGQGQIVQVRKMAKYNQQFKTEVSLMAYPSGVYYIKVLDDEMTQLARIIKI